MNVHALRHANTQVGTGTPVLLLITDQAFEQPGISSATTFCTLRSTLRNGKTRETACKGRCNLTAIGLHGLDIVA